MCMCVSKKYIFMIYHIFSFLLYIYIYIYIHTHPHTYSLINEFKIIFVFLF